MLGMIEHSSMSTVQQHTHRYTVHPSARLYARLSVRLSARLSTCLSVCLSLPSCFYVQQSTIVKERSMLNASK